MDGRKLIFFDFEVYSESIHPLTGKAYWMVVFIEFETRKKFTIKNDIEKLKWFYQNYKDDVFVGYNVRGYDQWVFKGLMMGMDAGIITKRIIEDDVKGHNVVVGAWDYPLYIYDCSTGFHGLKQLEAFMGSKIKESDVPFNINRPLTQAEEDEIESYCTHDVKETIKVFEKLFNKYKAHIGLLDKFELDIQYISKTSAQLTAEILEAKKFNDRGDKFDFKYPETLDLNKYTEVFNFFESIKNGTFIPAKFVKGKPKIELEMDIAGVPTTYALGGVHGAIPNFQYEGKIYALDVASLYPSLMIEYGLMSRAVESDEKFKNIKAERLVLKRLKDAIQESLKLILNTTYGTMGDKYNPMCDLKMMYSVCVTGQLLLTDFIEKIEPYCKVFNINTDGVYFVCEDDKNLEKIMEAKEEWEKRTRLELELDEYSKIAQKDVNNYIVVPKGELYTEDGKPRWTSKGKYVKKLSEIDYDLPIVNFAVNYYFLKGIPVEETINNCNDLRDFQRIVKLTKQYDRALKNTKFEKVKEENPETGRMRSVMKMTYEGELLQDTTFRVFASTREEDGGLFKHKLGENPAKFADTPDKCFIDNEEVLGKGIPEYLDRNWYIALAKKRVNHYLGIKETKATMNKYRVEYVDDSNKDRKCTLKAYSEEELVIKFKEAKPLCVIKSFVEVE